MTKNQKRILAVIVIMLIVFSVIAFALPFKKNAVFLLSYLFGVLAIGIQLYVLKVAFAGADTVKSKFYGFPIARIGAIYMAVQILFSVTFMALAAIAPAWLVILSGVLGFAAAAIGFIGADAMRDEVERQDVKLKADTSCMMTLRSKVYSLVDRCEDAEAKKALASLADEFRYSDPVSEEALITIEYELEKAVSSLQGAVSSGDSNQIKVSCKNISTLLSERNRLCKLSKKR